MTTYVTLINFTEQGLKTIKDTVKRSEAAKKTAAANGVKVKEILWLQGRSYPDSSDCDWLYWLDKEYLAAENRS